MGARKHRRRSCAGHLGVRSDEPGTGCMRTSEKLPFDWDTLSPDRHSLRGEARQACRPALYSPTIS